MKFLKTLKLLALAVCSACALSVSAAEAAKVQPAQPAAPKAADINELLKFLPATIVECNGKAFITRDELLKDLKPMPQQALDQNIPVEAKQVEAVAYNIADSLAVSKLILAEAKAKKIVADKKAAEDQLKMMEEQINAQAPGAFEEELKKFGMTREMIMEKLLDQSMIQKYIEQLASTASAIAEVTEKDMKEFYEANKDGMTQPASLSAAHILISFANPKPNADEKAAALKKCEEVRKQLKADGSNFGELAKANSSCPSKDKGGDLGQFQKGQMVREFEDALLKLKEGEISAPVETIYGYHIIKAGPATPERKITFDEVKDRIKQYLTESRQGQAQSEAVQKGLDELKKKNGFKNMLPAAALPMPAVN